MRYLIMNKILLFSIGLIVLSQHAKAASLQITVIPESDLHAGRVSDGAELATIHISGINRNCHLNMWIESAGKEITPGHYVLVSEENARKTLNVELTGDNWQPNLHSGKGMTLIRPKEIVTLRLIASGDQLLSINTWDVRFTAQCVMNTSFSEE